MKLFRRMCHPTDFSKASGPAFKEALEWAKRERVELRLVNVVMPPAVFLEDSFMSGRARPWPGRSRPGESSGSPPSESRPHRAGATDRSVCRNVAARGDHGSAHWPPALPQVELSDSARSSALSLSKSARRRRSTVRLEPRLCLRAAEGRGGLGEWLRLGCGSRNDLAGIRCLGASV